jgi:hypothetical protein
VKEATKLGAKNSRTDAARSRAIWLHQFGGSHTPSNEPLGGNNGFLGIQRHAYALFKPKFDITRFRFLFARRLTSSLQALGDLDEDMSLCSTGLVSLKASLAKESMHVRMLFLKTLAGAWTTSVRMHEREIQSCLFGCPESLDEVGHYLRCPVLWICIDLRAPPNSPEAIIDSLCLKGPVDYGIRQIASAFSVYHATKNLHRHIVGAA